MNDIVKLRQMIECGYVVTEVRVDSSNKGVITLTFSGTGNPLEGQLYFLITEDQLVIDRARERMK